MKLLARCAVAVSLLIVAGCAGDTAADDGTVTISFLSYNYGTPDIGGQGTQELLDAFHAAHPEITVEPEGVAVKDVLTKLRTDTAAGSAPDVAQIGWSKMAEAYANLPIVPLPDIAGAEWQPHVAGMSPEIMKATAVDGVNKAMPYTMSVPVTYYNADLFTAAGLDPARPPKTMAELKEAGLKLSAAGGNGVYIGVVETGKSDFLTQSLIGSNGGSLVGPDGSVTVDQPAAVEALAGVQDLVKSGAMPGIKADEALSLFSAGKLGALITSTAFLAAAEKAAQGSFDLRTTGFPAYGDKPARPTYSGAGLAVLAKDPAKQKAAWELVKFLTSEQGFTIITKKIGYLPLRPAIVTDPQYLADYFASDNRLKPSLDQLPTVAPYTAFPGKRANEAVVTLQDEAVEPIVLRGADPAKTLGEVAGKIRTMTSG